MNFIFLFKEWQEQSQVVLSRVNTDKAVAISRVNPELALAVLFGVSLNFACSYY
jgi:hypothetical protein